MKQIAFVASIDDIEELTLLTHYKSNVKVHGIIFYVKNELHCTITQRSACSNNWQRKLNYCFHQTEVMTEKQKN